MMSRHWLALCLLLAAHAVRAQSPAVTLHLETDTGQTQFRQGEAMDIWMAGERDFDLAKF
jgi:hypothetical protein